MHAVSTVGVGKIQKVLPCHRTMVCVVAMHPLRVPLVNTYRVPRVKMSTTEGRTNNAVDVANAIEKKDCASAILVLLDPVAKFNASTNAAVTEFVFLPLSVPACAIVNPVTVA